jgi:hypothetical protein
VTSVDFETLTWGSRGVFGLHFNITNYAGPNFFESGDYFTIGWGFLNDGNS